MPLNITINNYKSIRSVQLKLRPGLTILIGPNGSGKTSLLSALQFIRDILRVGAAQAIARQGGFKRVYHRGQREIYFSCDQPYGQRIYRHNSIPCDFHWSFRIAQAGPEHIATIIKEQISIKGLYQGKSVLLFSLVIDRRDPGKPKIDIDLSAPTEFGRDLFSFWQVEFGNRNKKAIADLFRRRFLKDRLGSIKVEPDRSCFPLLSYLDRKTAELHNNFVYLNEYNILPEIARQSTEQLPFSQMAPNGASVSEVIHSLENHHYHKLAQLDYMDFEDVYAPGFFAYKYRPSYYWRYGRMGRHRMEGVKRPSYETALENINQELAAAVKPINKVSVDIDPTNGRRFVVFKADQDTFYPEEVSDGTVKWLCILVSLFVPYSRVYLLEEPENFLHPWMQQRLIEIMRRQAKVGGTIFFLSSHSATILNSAQPEEILLVKQTKKGTKTSELRDMTSIKQVLAESDFHLGDLWISGAIGGVPSDV